jgi:hypothetical protein
MCKAFSGVATRRKVYWKLAMDSHEDIKEYFKLDDSSDKLCPFEISPKNEDYLKPDKWVFRFDDKCPNWWKQSNESMCWDAFKEWKKKTYYKIRAGKKIVHPFKIKPPKRITKKHIKLLKECDSIWDSVGDSIWDSVGASVYGYTGSFFKIPRKDWKYTENIKCKGYPFESVCKLWNMGLVPSFDGKVWRLYGKKNAKVLFEISKEELSKEKGE